MDDMRTEEQIDASTVLLARMHLWHYIAKGYTRFPEQTEEIVQDAFVSFLSAAATRRWDSEGQLVNYMKLVVRTRAVDFLRTQGRRRDIKRSLWHEGTHSDMRTPEAAFIDVECTTATARRVAVVMARLNRLPAKHRDAIVAVYLRGTTLAGYARQRGIPKSTAQGRISRGLKFLRRKGMMAA